MIGFKSDNKLSFNSNSLMFGIGINKSLVGNIDTYLVNMSTSFSHVYLGLSFQYFTDYSEIYATGRPEIGFRYKYFKVFYGISIINEDSFLGDVSAHSVGAIYQISIKNKVIFK